eukprot:745720-Hanusia_phi.AAC.1
MKGVQSREKSVKGFSTSKKCEMDANIHENDLVTWSRSAVMKDFVPTGGRIEWKHGQTEIVVHAGITQSKPFDLSVAGH